MMQSNPNSPFRSFLRKFRKQRVAVMALAVVIVILIVGMFGQWLAPYDPSRPVTDQYEEKGMKASAESSGQVGLKVRMSDGKEVPWSTLEDTQVKSSNSEVAMARSFDQGAVITAVSKGNSQVVITAGDVSIVVMAGVSEKNLAPSLSRLDATSHAGRIAVGENVSLKLTGYMTDGTELAGLESIKAAAASGVTEEKKDDGFNTSDKGAASKDVKLVSLTPSVLQVTGETGVKVVGEGQGLLKVTAGPVSTVVVVNGGAGAKVVPVALNADKTQLQLQDLYKHQPPSAKHWFGTDHANRDIFSRVLAGTQQTLIIGFMSVSIGAAIGIFLGLLSGYYGKWMDTLITRGADILLSFPGMLLAIFVIAVLGPGLVNIIFAVAIFTVPIFIRIVRGSVLSLKGMTYVEAARSIGVKNSTIIWRHIFPGTVSVVMVYLTMRIGSAILIGAGLSYLGLGGDVTAPEWGSMLSTAKNNSKGLFHPLFFPGFSIVITVLSFNLLGDGLRDALDPKLKD